MQIYYYLTKLINQETSETNKTKLTNKKIGANLLLPSQKLSKDMYLYKKIFYYCDKKKKIKTEKILDNKLNIIYSENENQYQKNLNKLNQIYKTLGKKKKILDNKLNIIYSENEHQYQKNLNKLNQIYKTLGKKKIYNIEPSQSENKVKNLQKRVEFMKRVVDYTYPDMVLTKIKEQDKTIFEKSVVPVNIITSKVKRKKDRMFNNRISQGLVKSINIQKCIFKGLNRNKGFET